MSKQDAGDKRSQAISMSDLGASLPLGGTAGNIQLVADSQGVSADRQLLQAPESKGNRATRVRMCPVRVETEEELCDLCCKIDFNQVERTFSYESEPTWVSMTWKLEDLRQPQECPFCRMLLSIVEGTEHTKTISTGMVSCELFYSMSADSIEWVPAMVAVMVSPTQGQSPRRSSQLRIRCRHGILPLRRASALSDSTSIFKARLINQSYADIDLMSSWILHCDRNHADSCGRRIDSSANRAPHMVKLVDVDRACIINGGESSQCRYLVLSYVWGAVKQPMLVMATENAWSRPGALNNLALPKTIQDAISLTRQLGEKYLWVDSLCIIQDDTDHRKYQIGTMDLIYRRAALTIVAACGNDCNVGLTGLPSSHSRFAGQPLGKVNSVELAGVLLSFSEDLRNSIWKTRGWTFQEEVLSRRCVIFLPSQVLFRCCKAFWREDVWLESEDCIHGGGAQVPMLDLLGVSLDSQSPRRTYLKEYTLLIEGYYRRNLTNQRDILDAVMGILGVLYPIIGEFTYGLPEAFFHEALCWTSGQDPGYRREGFPSWSWTGWISGNLGRLLFPLNDLVDGLIQFYSGDVRGNAFPPPPPCQQNLDKSFLIHFEPLNMSEVARVRNELLNGQANSLGSFLIFNTSSAYVDICHPLKAGPEPSRLDNYEILVSGGDLYISSLWLYTEWVSKQSNPLELIVLAFYSDTKKLVAMLIEWKDGIAYRVQISGPISHDDWLAANPSRKLITLG